MTFHPKYTITPSIAKALASIEVCGHAIIELPITATMIATLQESARISSTHHSTAIEGNRLSMAEVRDVLEGGGNFPHREKDEAEVRNYYDALTVGSDEDYYDGQRATGNLTRFLNYFVDGMAESFENIKNQAKRAQARGDLDQSPLLRDLDRQQKQALKLFMISKENTAKDIADFFQLSERQSRHLCQKWVAEGVMEVSNPAPKTRKYRLCEKYETLILNQIREHEN